MPKAPSRFAQDARRLGQTVRRLRRRRGWTQEQLAQRMGTAVSTVARTERGEGNPGLETLSSMAETLEVATAELLGGEPQRSPEEMGRSLEQRIRALSQSRDSRSLALAEAVLDRLETYTT